METFQELVARVNRNAFIFEEKVVMAKPVKVAKGKEFAFKSAAGAAVGKYPWDEWFSGELLMIEQDTTDAAGKVHKRDFDVEVNAMPAKIKTAARRRYKVVQVSRLDADGKKLVDSLIIRARDMTPDERVAEDLLRAEEKVENDERRAEKKASATSPTTTPTIADTGAA